MREDMIFVKGGKYKLFENNNIEVETFDLEVSKYLVTQKLWTDVMGRNPSLVKDILGMKPVENITWWHTLQFCNKLSELEGLKPVYDLSQIKSAKLYINQLDDEKSINYYEDFLIDKNGKIGDFSKTEGYRLPTSIEWEWFAGDGQKAINKGTFGHIFHKSDNLDQIAWYRYNSLLTTHNIAEKIPNELRIFDCIGNVYEWCHDQRYEFKNFKEEKGSTFYNMYKVIMGGSFYSDSEDFYPFIFSYPSIGACIDIGFRFVKTFRGNMSEIFLLNSKKKISIKKILELAGKFDSFKFQDIPDYDVAFDEKVEDYNKDLEIKNDEEDYKILSSINIGDNHPYFLSQEIIDAIFFDEKNYSDERKIINNYEEENTRLSMNEDLLKYPLSAIGPVRICKENCIRGFEVFYDRFFSNYGIRIFSPCTRKDWEEAIKYIKKLSKMLNTDIRTEDGEIYTRENIEKYPYDKSILAGLNYLSKHISAFIDTNINYIFFNKEIVEKIKKSKDKIKTFEQTVYMIKKELDKKEAERFERKELKSISYTIYENKEVILFLNPNLDFSNRKSAENSQYKIDFALLIKDTQNDYFLFHSVEYNTFIKMLPKNTYKYIDARRILVKPLTREEIYLLSKRAIKNLLYKKFIDRN